MVNVLIANNTFVNSKSTSGIQINDGSHQNVRFYNTIVQQDGPLPVASMGTGRGITFSHNLWSKAPPSNAIGSGDVIGDPRLSKSGNFTSPAWYALQASSPAQNNAMPINEVTHDFFQRLREQSPNIGALE